MLGRKILAVVVMMTLWIGTPAVAQGNRPAPDPFAYRWERFGPKFDQPLFITHAGDGSGRLFVLEQAGAIWVLNGRGEMLPTPFLDINALTTEDTLRGGYTERGLLGLAFHPRFKANGQFFIAYTDAQGAGTLARYRISADNPDRADPASAQVLLTIPDPAFDHNGGMIAFGPDGYLYYSQGDGGGTQGDPENDSQNLLSLLGKILRLDVNAVTGNLPYGIPADNPFVGRADARPEIWASGLRNPWRFSFDRLTGDLYIADVGWGNYEEVNFQAGGAPGGQNYGWNFFEGLNRIIPPINPGPEPADLTAPVFAYNHQAGCSVTGGYVYRGRELPGLYGVYIFGDYCNGQTWMLYRDGGNWQHIAFKLTGHQISAFGEDERGELYLVDYKGYLYRLRTA